MSKTATRKSADQPTEEDQVSLTFEEALEELELITRKLEDGKESLEKSMALYERGIILKNFCEKKLTEAEGKWMVLQKDKNGTVKATEIDKEKFSSETAAPSGSPLGTPSDPTKDPKAAKDSRAQQGSIF